MKTQPICIRRGLTLYKQPLTSRGGSPNWYARVWMRIGSQCVHTKSTGTTDAITAKRFAEDLYVECLVRRRYGNDGGSTNAGAAAANRRFDVIADQWLDWKKLSAGTDRRKYRAFDDARKLVIAPNGLGAFFKRTDIGSITTAMVRQYLCFAAEHSKKGELASTTQRNHLAVLNGILKFAAEQGIIAAPAPMPKLHLKDNPRPCFTNDEFNALCLTARVLERLSRSKEDHRTACDFAELGDFLQFMVATFLRAGEWKELRQRHCRVIGGEHPYLEVAVPNGKTHKRKVVSMPQAIDVAQRIVERAGDDPDGFLFLNRYANRDTAQERMRDGFEAVLKEAGLAFDEFGNKRTIYSIRHTALMSRLIDGENVDLLMLARNAGTSIDQLERFYLSHADPAMKVGNLHSLRPQPVVEEVELPEMHRGGIQIRASLDELGTLAFA